MLLLPFHIYINIRLYLEDGHVKKKSKVNNVYVEGEQEQYSSAVALPDNIKNATADAYSIQDYRHRCC